MSRILLTLIFASGIRMLFLIDNYQSFQYSIPYQKRGAFHRVPAPSRITVQDSCWGEVLSRIFQRGRSYSANFAAGAVEKMPIAHVCCVLCFWLWVRNCMYFSMIFLWYSQTQTALLAMNCWCVFVSLHHLLTRHSRCSHALNQMTMAN